jgi:hypothetical protein
MAHVEDSTNLPVISDLAQFDRNSGSWLERLVFNHRAIVVLLCARGDAGTSATTP